MATWTGGGADNNWTTAANWDSAPIAGDSLIFPANGVDNTSLINVNNFPADTVFASIELRGNGYTINGNRITLGAGGVFASTPGGAHIWNTALLINGLGVPFTIVDGTSLTINGVLSGNAPLNKGADGTLIITADNNGVEPFSGFVNVNAGVVQVSHPQALGNTTGETNVVDFATLQFNAGSDGGGEVIRLGGTLIAAATVTWNGLVEALGTEICVNAGATLTLEDGGLVGNPILKTGPGTLAVADGAFGGGTVEEGVLNFQGNVDVGNITVNNGAAVELQGSVTIDAGTLSIQGAGPTGAGALRNISGNNTWVGPVSLAAASSIGSTAGTLTLTRDINNGDFLLTVAGAGNTTFANTGVLSGAGGLTKIGGGTLILEGTGVNTYAGATNVNGGVLNIRKASALGAAAGTGTTVATGAALQVQGGIAFNAEPLTLNGSGIGATGALRNVNGNNSWPANITLASASTIGSNAGTLTVNGNIANAGFLLTVTGAGSTTFGGAGIVSGGGGLTKTGTGTLTLEGTAANTYGGPTTVNGTLRLNKQTASITAVPGSLAINGLNSTLPAVVTLLNDHQIANSSAISINAFGTLALNNRSEAIGALTMSGGDVTTGSGLLTLGGNITATSSSTTGPAEISGRLSLGGLNRTFTVNDGTNSIDMLVSALISSGTSGGTGFPAGLVKAGPGTLHFTGNNTYNRTEISAGRLIVDGVQSGSTALNRGVFVRAAATLSGIGALEPLTVNAGGTVSPGSGSIGTLTSAGNLVLQAGSRFEAQVVPIFGILPDQLAVTGSVSPGNASLVIQPLFVNGAAPGSTFRIIDNDGVDAVAGTFLNLPENTEFPVQVQGVVNGQPVFQTQFYRISYLGGTGNDVVLTYINTATMARDLAVTPDVIREGERVTLTGRLVDPDRQSRLTLQVDWGDGSPVQTRHPGTEPFKLVHRYRDNPAGQPNGGQYRIRVTWFDEFGAGNSQDRFVTVNNIAPTVNVGGPRTIQAGQWFRSKGRFADVKADTWTATVNYGDGTGDHRINLNSKQQFRLRHRFLKPGNYTVVVTVVDDDGGIGRASFDVNVI